MTGFESLNSLLDAELRLEQRGTQNDFYGYQHFLFGCCDWLRGFMEYPKVKDAYEKVKLGLGSRSVFVKTPGYRDMSVFRGQERKSCQYTIYCLLGALQEHQDMTSLGTATYMNLRGLWKFLPKHHLSRIWQDTVVDAPKYDKKYPIEIRRMGWQLRAEEKYTELPVLGDLCEDMNYMEEANHFRDPDCLHTYACRWLHSICKGMDGR